MGDPTGFLKFDRQDVTKEPVSQRLKHWNEFAKAVPDDELQTQGARCMDCGISFCHWTCPVSNIIPDLNHFVYKGRWEEAFKRLQETNNFPEITGRICPALCEDACVLSINQPAVTIKNIEFTIIEKAYEEGWIKPKPPTNRTGKKVAVVGSGPSGLACADQLNKMGHTVRVYEKNEEIGGILRFGIPDFKLEKKVIQRRIDIMHEEGVVFKPGTHIGADVKASYLQKEYDAVVLCGGSEQPRDLPVPGRALEGICPAMEFLVQQNRVNNGQSIDPKERITAEGRKWLFWVEEIQALIVLEHPIGKGQNLLNNLNFFQNLLKKEHLIILGRNGLLNIENLLRMKKA